MAEKAGRILPAYRNHYNILVQFVKNYLSGLFAVG
jgi:hypothetical protein